MPTKFYKEEFPLNTVNTNELQLQFAVMKSLGYSSLFDPDFRRELRNPIRKYLYYRLVIQNQNEDRKFLRDGFEFVADRIAFFSDPELFKKFKDNQMQSRIDSEGVPQKEIAEKERVLSREQAKHNLTEQDKVEVSDFLSKAR